MMFVDLGEAERGERSLPMKHWTRLAEAIGVTPAFVAKCCLDAGTVTVDLRDATPELRTMVAYYISGMAP